MNFTTNYNSICELSPEKNSGILVVSVLVILLMTVKDTQAI